MDRSIVVVLRIEMREKHHYRTILWNPIRNAAVHYLSSGIRPRSPERMVMGDGKYSDNVVFRGDAKEGGEWGRCVRWAAGLRDLPFMMSAKSFYFFDPISPLSAFSRNLSD